MTDLNVPILVGDLHLDASFPELNRDGRYRGARLLARLHGLPLGEVLLPLEQRPLTTTELAARVWPLIGDRVRDHCADDGIAPPGRLTSAGLARPERPRCTACRVVADEPPITVVIATRDRTESLLRCLASLSQVDYSAFDVVVVDSAPRTDATAHALSERSALRFPLRYVRVSRPGVALAHNAALPEVTGGVVAIADDDVEVDRAWLAALARAFTESDASCVTGLILPAQLETRAQLLVEQAGGFARGFTRRTFSSAMPAPEPLFPFTAGRFGSGANMAFRTDWLAARGGFDPAAGTGTPARGGQELIAFLQVITGGGTLVYEPEAIVRHWHRPHYDGMRRQAFGYGVGLGAYLAASVRAQPGLLGPMLRRTVPAARHLLSNGSAKNVAREASFPRELVRREMAGVLIGPFAYAVSRRRYRDCVTSGQGPGE
jgi:Glycosyl transferase family 2